MNSTADSGRDGSCKLVFWSELQSRWRALPPRVRGAVLREAAHTAHGLWSAGRDLADVPPDLWAVELDAAAPRVRFPTLAARSSPARATQEALVRALAEWLLQARGTLRPSEMLCFLRALLRPEAVDREGLRHAAAEIRAAAARRAAARSRALYQDALRDGPDDLAPVRGAWRPQPGIRAEELAREVEAAENAPAATVLKEDPSIRVVRTSLFGRDVLLKRYTLDGLLVRLKYLGRLSRARRFWAAARTLAALGIPTPEPLGYLEFRAGRVVPRSYVITAFVAEPVARAWIRQSYPSQPPAVRGAVRRSLLRCLLDLYGQGIYHRDTKLSNLLLAAPEDEARRAFWWLDLECVEFGAAPTRHRVVRNLVQINGSLSADVTEADRCAFLRDLARVYPWATKPAVIRKIRRWTARRLAREKHLPGP